MITSQLVRSASSCMRTTIRPFSSASIPRDVARIQIFGRLGTDPVVTETKVGPVTNYAVAVNHGKGDNQTTSWFKCVAFGEVGKNYLSNVPKGTKVFIEGDIKYNKYEGGDGKAHISPTVTQRTLTIVSDKKVISEEGREEEGEQERSSQYDQ